MRDVIDKILADHNVNAHVVAVSEGPTVTLFAIELGPATRVEAIERIHSTLSVRLGFEDLRLVTPIPGTTYVGLEVPRADPETVPWDRHAEYDTPLCVPVGKTSATGEPVTLDLAKAPHLLIAGTTGSGKSVALNAMLTTLVRRGLDRVRLTMIDPKQVELTPYDDVANVVTDMSEAAETVAGLVEVMEERYSVLRDAGMRHADELDLPYHVLVVDELADLVMQNKEVESHLVRLAQKGRAARVHMILATQRPTKDVVTGLLKANIPTRLSFAVMSTTDSMVILDQPGAQTLVGQGDGLLLGPGQRRPVRIQAPFISTAEVDAEVEIEATRQRSSNRAPYPWKSKKRNVLSFDPAPADDFPRDVKPPSVLLSETEKELRDASRGLTG